MIGPTVAVRIDEWTLPSHAQADRVAEGTLDLAVAWVTAAGADQRNLRAHLLFAQTLHAVATGANSDEPVPADRVNVLVDADESAWSSWNRFAEEFAADTGARVTSIDDGGITGEGYYGHVRRARTAVLASPKRHTVPPPPTLGVRPVDPAPIWTCSLLHRQDGRRATVRHVVDVLQRHAEKMGWTTPPAGRWWAPSDDPHLTTGP